MARRDYYEVLGVDKNASADEIKRAYRKLAVKHHPDKEGGDEAKFKEAAEAYEVLKDPEKRQRYDQFGHAAYKSAAGSSGAGYGPFQGYGGQQFEFDLGDLDLGDIFGSFFGGGRTQSSARGRTRSRGRDLEAALAIDFKEAVFGTEKTISLNLEDFCPRCKGEMSEPGHGVKTCDECGGKGQVVQSQRTMLGTIQHASTCKTCHGSGSVPEKACQECNGKGTKRRRQEFKIKIPAGIRDGAAIRLRERGEAPPTGKGGVKGDLYVHIKVKPSKKFTRQGNVIRSEEALGMVEAALGAEIEVETVDGTKKVKVPAGTQDGDVIKLPGLGVPVGDGSYRGDQLVTIRVKIPRKLSAKQKDLLKEFNKHSKKGWFK